MVSAEREPMMGVWGQSPWWRFRGAKPPWARAKSAPEAENFSCFWSLKEAIF